MSEAVNIDRCYYRTTTFDPETNLPLYVLDLTFIPSTILKQSGTAPDIDSQPKLQNFINSIIERLSNENHALVLFTNGFYQSAQSSDQSSFKLPLNIIKIFKLIPIDSKKYLRKIYIVHGNWIIKSVIDIFTKFYSFNSNLNPIFINCDNLSSLSHYLDITKLPISLHTYLIDKIQYKNNKIILNRHFPPLYARPLTIYSLYNSNPVNSSLPLNQFQRIFNNLIAYLSNKSLDIELTATDWNTIIKCSALSNETKISIDILSDCLKRDQLIVLSDYSFLEHYMIIIKFILKLSNSKFPLIPLEILLEYSVDFNNLNQVNTFFNKVLTFRHPLVDLNGLKSTQEHHNLNEIDSYDNAYILIKIFKLFKYLLNKLERETHILEPNAKNHIKSIERQSLRIILAFTKILYTDNNEDSLASNDDDDIGFDNLFKLIRSVMQHFDTLTILGTNYTLDDFNNHISFDDFLAFENFKNKQLGVQDVLESKIIDNSKKLNLSPVKPKASNTHDLQPLPPMPRKNKLFAKSTTSTNERSVSTSSNESNPSSVSSSSSYLLTSADASIPITKSEVEILANSVESLGIEDSDDLFKTPKRSTLSPYSADSCPDADHDDLETINDMVGDLLTPTKPTLNPHTLLHKVSQNSLMQRNLRKYTEKDLVVQQQVEKEKQAAMMKEQHAKEVEKGVRRGERKVSRLARLYEEKYMQ